MRVRFLEKNRQLIVDKQCVNAYYQIEDNQFIDIFLPFLQKYEIVGDYSPANVCILGIQHEDNTLLRDTEINIFVSLENMSVGRTHYKYYNKYKRSNKRVHIHLFNDISHPDVTNMYIPVIYMRINYFNAIYNNFVYKNIRQQTSFNNKKFCLFTSRNGLNTNKQLFLNKIITPTEKKNETKQIKY